MKQLTLHYSVQNGGDGSAYPRFFESKELAAWDQDAQNEDGDGWGEPCTGEITVMADKDCELTAKLLTREKYLLEYLIDGYYSNEDEKVDRIVWFAKELYPEGLPNIRADKVGNPVRKIMDKVRAKL